MPETLIMEKNSETQTYADDLIGAAQALERAARFLKAQALTVRRYGLLKVERPIYREAQAAYVRAAGNDAADIIISAAVK